MNVGLRMVGRPWFWVWAVATPGGGYCGCCRSVGATVLKVSAASGVKAAPCHSWRRVPLVLLMVRVVVGMELLMPMLLQVLYRAMPRVRALRVAMLLLGGGGAGDADDEGAVGDVLGVADAEGVLLVVLWLMVLMLMPGVKALQVMSRFTVYLVMMMIRAAAGGGPAVGPRVGGLWPVFGRGPSLFLAWGPGGRCCLPSVPPVLLVPLVMPTVRVRRR